MNNAAIRSEVLRLLEAVAGRTGRELPGGAAEPAIADFESRTEIILPSDMRAWLQLCDGPSVGGIEILGIGTEPPLKIEDVLASWPKWAMRRWLPVAGDGFGNYYVIDTGAQRSLAGFVFFVDTMADSDTPTYYCASTVWHLLRGLLSAELGQEHWPFDDAALRKHDPELFNLDPSLLPSHDD